MYLWNYAALVKDFKEHKVTAREKLKYLLVMMIYVPTGLMGSNWVPAIYRFIYQLANDILARQAPQVPSLKIYDDYNHLFDIAMVSISVLGIIACFIANHKGDGRNFIERFMCLSVPISIRVGVYFLLLFLGVMAASLFFFHYQLQFIAQVRGFFKIFKKLRYLKELTPVMQYVSHQLHLFAGVVSLISLATSFLILRSSIKSISTHKE